MPAWMKKVDSPFAAFSVIQPSPTISLRSPEMPETSMERFLFHHYTTHVAKIMMPYDHPFNPWIQQYPAAALVGRGSTDHALYDALLAHAAYNLSELYGKDGTMLYQATRYYDKAIQKVLARIESKSSGFATTFASILTLVLVEVYSGNASKWRQHLQGANTLVQTTRSDMEGLESVKTSVQSLHIIHIIGQTSKHLPSKSHKTLLSSCDIPDTPDFGFTIGASKEVLQCISQITDLNHKIAGGEPIDHVMPELRSITGFLDDYHASQSKTYGRAGNTPQHYQSLAFVSASKIYLHRIIFNVPPKSVQSLVSSTLEEVMKFRQVDSQNNFSIWPAFIAAVEAYTEQDMQDAEKWLDWFSTFGMGNRTSIANVVREVWQRREEKSRRLELDKGLVCVDWREIMDERGCDVLLV